MKTKVLLFVAVISVFCVLCCSMVFAEDMHINEYLFSPSGMASRFNLRINDYYEAITGESAYSTTVNNDLYLWKDYTESDDEKTVYANTFKTFKLTFYCKNEFSYAEDVIIYADTSSLNKWNSLPIKIYAAVIDEINQDYGWSTNLYGWSYDGNHYSPYYGPTFAANYTTSGFKHTVEMIATTHLTVKHSAMAPTDTLPGYRSFWSCMSCSRIFADPDGHCEISEPIPIPPINEMTVLYLPDNLKIIESEALSDLACEAVIIPEGCTTVGEKAFLNCKNLLYIRLPASAKDIAASAFDGCDNVTVFQVIAPGDDAE